MKKKDMMMTRKVEGGGGIVFVLLVKEEEEEVGPTLPWPHLPTVPTMRNCSPPMSPCHLNQGLLLLLLLLRCNRNNNTNHIIVGIIFHIDSREVVLVIVLLENPYRSRQPKVHSLLYTPFHPTMMHRPLYAHMI